MIITENLGDGRTYTYSDQRKWIRQIETDKEYETAIDSITYTYEEINRYIEDESINEEEINNILLGNF